MSRILALLLLSICFVWSPGAHAQVMKIARTIPGGDFTLSGSPTVYIDGGTNEIALFVYGLYGLSGTTNLRVRAGFFESNNYIGGNFEWAIRRGGPAVTFSAGGHYHNDPAADATLNLSGAVRKNLSLYGGLDADLIFDDDPDLPLWAFLGFSIDLLDHFDIVMEFNYGLVEVAPHVLASGFVFYF